MEKVVCVNRKARHDYAVLDRFEAGIVLKGTEVKSLRNGQANLRDGFARVEEGEIYLYNVHIAPYEAGNIMNHEPMRPRKLLLHRSEIERLAGKIDQRGLALVPLKLYFKRGKAKVEMAIARGKRAYDKRETMKRREVEQEMRRALKKK